MILTIKDFFLTTLKDALENDHAVINAKEELKRTRGELEALDARLKAIEKLNDEFSITVTKEIKIQIRAKQINKVNIENDFLTKYNVDTFLQSIKILVNPYKSKIKTVDEFPFKKLFSKIIVKSRNNIIFVIGKQHNYKDVNLNQPGILIAEVDYLIINNIHIQTSDYIFLASSTLPLRTKPK